MKVGTQIRLRIDLCREAGIEMAHPKRDIHLHTPRGRFPCGLKLARKAQADRSSRPGGGRVTFFYISSLRSVYIGPMSQQVTRLWLMYPSRLITRPVIYELGKKFPVVTNIRQASVTDEIGVVSIELDGEREEIKKAIAWLEELGIKVEPVEINTIEG